MSQVSKDYVKAITEQANWELRKGQQIDECKDMNEAEEAPVHVCPLCQSQLDEAISEESLLEHSAAMLQVFSAVEETLNEAVEDAYEEESEEDLEDSDEESEEDFEDEEEYEEEDEEDEE
jgi:hypothetical protein